MTKKDKIFLEWLDGTRIKEISPSGTFWRRKGKLHREDGPAVEYANGTKEWWINDEKLTKGEFLKRKKGPCDGKVVEIDGKKYKLVSI